MLFVSMLTSTLDQHLLPLSSIWKTLSRIWHWNIYEVYYIYIYIYFIWTQTHYKGLFSVLHIQKNIYSLAQICGYLGLYLGSTVLPPPCLSLSSVPPVPRPPRPRYQCTDSASQSTYEIRSNFMTKTERLRLCILIVSRVIIVGVVQLLSTRITFSAVNTHTDLCPTSYFQTVKYFPATSW